MNTVTPPTRPLPRDFAAYLGAHQMEERIAWGMGNLLAASITVTNALEERTLRDAGLTLAGWRILVTLCINGPSEPRDIADLLLVSRPTVTNSLNTLERAGLIVRVPEDRDRRLIQVVPTDLARELFDGIMPRYYEAMSDILGVLNEDEQRLFVDFLGRVALNARPRPQRPPRRSTPSA